MSDYGKQELQKLLDYFKSIDTKEYNELYEIAKTLEEIPNPGSDDAIVLQCKCPIIDNGHGNPELGRIRGFYISEGCPLHDNRVWDKKND